MKSFFKRFPQALSKGRTNSTLQASHTKKGTINAFYTKKEKSDDSITVDQTNPEQLVRLLTRLHRPHACSWFIRKTVKVKLQTGAASERKIHEWGRGKEGGGGAELTHRGRIQSKQPARMRVLTLSVCSTRSLPCLRRSRSESSSSLCVRARSSSISNSSVLRRSASASLAWVLREQISFSSPWISRSFSSIHSCSWLMVFSQSSKVMSLELWVFAFSLLSASVSSSFNSMTRCSSETVPSKSPTFSVSCASIFVLESCRTFSSPSLWSICSCRSFTLSCKPASLSWTSCFSLAFSASSSSCLASSSRPFSTLLRSSSTSECNSFSRRAISCSTEATWSSSTQKLNLMPPLLSMSSETSLTQSSSTPKLNVMPTILSMSSETSFTQSSSTPKLNVMPTILSMSSETSFTQSSSTPKLNVMPTILSTQSLLT